VTERDHPEDLDPHAEVDLPADAPEPPDRPDAVGRDNVRSMGTEGEDRAQEMLEAFDPDEEGPTPDPDPDVVPETDPNPPPEYAIGGLSGIGAIPPEEQIAAYRRRYGRLRTYFRARASRYGGIQRSLNQARMGEPYDAYLARAATYAAVAGVLGALVGALATGSLAAGGAFDGLRSPVPVGGTVATFIGANRVFFGGATLALGLAVVFAAVAYLSVVYYPAATVVTRRQAIDVTLPHAIVYMYALSYGGTNLTEVVRSVAGAEDT
jgi:flagellar protein FlaJ